MIVTANAQMRDIMPFATKMGLKIQKPASFATFEALAALKLMTRLQFRAETSAL
ncbi:hypothetical protein HGG75_15480 [Ochrobactrum pseudogrignonense]|nr:hypothetical protein [Brucella pseudogrignonensis]